MRKGFCIILILCLLVSCRPQREKQIDVEEKPDKLVVYVTATHCSNNLDGDYYATYYSLGPFATLTNGNAEKGYMYYNDFRNFEKEMGIELEVEYFRTLYEMESKLKEDNINDTLPDVILTDKIIWDSYPELSNMYRAMANDWFLDVFPYMEEDGIYTSDEYFNTVLEAGQWKEHQYIIPLSFNLNAIFTSKEDMDELGVWINDEMTNSELLQQLEYACNLAPVGELSIDTLTLRSCPPAMIQAFWETTGLSIADYEDEKITVDKELFEQLAVFFKKYLQINMVEDWDTVLETVEPYMDEYREKWGAWMTPGMMETLDENKYHTRFEKDTSAERAYAWLEMGTFFLEENSLSSSHHSLPGQCVTLSSLYEDIDEELVMIGIPMREDNDNYMANVTSMGGVVSGTEHPYYSYQLLKYLMDRENDPYYTIPVKKDNAQKMLDTLGTSSYNLYLKSTRSSEFKPENYSEKYQYLLDPLTEDFKSQIEEMLNHIGGASLPQFSVYEPIVWHMEAYAFGMETLEEAYEESCAELQDHIEYILSGEAVYGGLPPIEEDETKKLDEQLEVKDAEAEKSDSGEMKSIRWGILGVYDDGNEKERNHYIDQDRSQNLNAALQAQGIDIQVEIVFLDDSYVGDPLVTIEEQEKQFDIISYHPQGISAEDMAQYLVSLEIYMLEDGLLNDVYQIYSESIWDVNRIDGHIYNVGQLITPITPTYTVTLKNEATELTIPQEIFTTGDENEILRYVEQEEGLIVVAEPYFNGRDSALFTERQFHMIAPGIGLNLDGGTEFENIWESTYVIDKLQLQEKWIQEGLGTSSMGGTRLINQSFLVLSNMDILSEVQITEVELVSGNQVIHGIYPLLENTRVAPLEDQYYTSILKSSSKTQDCVILLNLLNTNEELCKSIYEDPIVLEEHTATVSTGTFVYLCNSYIATENKDTAKLQSLRMESMEEDQISPIIGFTFDRTPVEEEMRKLEELHCPELNTAYMLTVGHEIMEDENDSKLYKESFSRIWKEEIENYLQKLEEAGIDKVIDEANRQLTAWQAKNRNMESVDK